MKKYVILFFYLILLLGNYTFSQTSDNSQRPRVEKKSFDTQKLQELAKEDAFDYNRKDIPRNYSLWELFKDWLGEKIAGFFRMMSDNESTTKNVLYVISVILMLYLIFKLLKINSRSLFYNTSEKVNQDQGIFTENIHEIDFKKALQEAIDLEQYKTAVRILYLALLKSLDSRDFIKWKSYKTNHDYETEIKDELVKKDFESLTKYFEYICYGDFTLDRNAFERAKVIYEKLESAIQKKVYS